MSSLSLFGTIDPDAANKLNAVNAFMMGKIKVEGDLNTVMKFQSMMG